MLVNLINLARRARAAEDALALQFIVANETFSLAAYVTACLWVRGEGIACISGVSQIDRHAPFPMWLAKVCDELHQLYPEASAVDVAALSHETAGAWSEWLPAYALWIPAIKSSGPEAFGLLFARNEPFRDDEIAVITEWVDIWRHAWEKLHAPGARGQFTKVTEGLRQWIPSRQGALAFLAELRRGVSLIRKDPSLIRQLFPKPAEFSVRAIWQDRRRRYTWIALLVVFFPVKLTVLAPAELVPSNPAVIRVPIEGVIGEFFVSPNQRVAEGDPLFQLDLTSLSARLQVARQEIQIAAAELRQSALQSLSDQKSRRLIVPQEGKAIERQLEADYLKDLLSKAQIKAPRAGVVLFDDPSEWVGRPVVAGERVMVVATEGDVEIEVWIPIGDAIELPEAASVTMFLNASPLSPVSGALRYLGHEAVQRPDGSYAYRLRAKVPSEDRGRRVGLKGTARVSGQFVPLSYWLLRKPLAWVRQFLGI